MSSHTDLWAVLAGNNYFINVILVICDKHRTKHYYVHNNDKKDTKFMTFLKVGIVQLFPHAIRPQQLKYITSMYTARLFVMHIRSLDLGGASEETLTLASP